MIGLSWAGYHYRSAQENQENLLLMQWRSVKYENIYIQDYATVPLLYQGLTHYFHFFNLKRPHQGLDYRIPAQVYYGKDMPIDKKNEIHLKFAQNWS